MLSEEEGLICLVFRLLIIIIIISIISSSFVMSASRIIVDREIEPIRWWPAFILFPVYITNTYNVVPPGWLSFLSNCSKQMQLKHVILTRFLYYSIPTPFRQLGLFWPHLKRPPFSLWIPPLLSWPFDFAKFSRSFDSMLLWPSSELQYFHRQNTLREIEFSTKLWFHHRAYVCVCVAAVFFSTYKQEHIFIFIYI